jgi:hypothetical protein
MITDANSAAILGLISAFYDTWNQKGGWRCSSIEQQDKLAVNTEKSVWYVAKW